MLDKGCRGVAVTGNDGLGNQAAGRPQLIGLLSKAQETLAGDLVPEQLDLASDLSGAAERYHARGQLEQAKLGYILAGALQEAILGNEDLDVALTQFNLAAVYETAGRLDLAEQLYGNALNIMESQLGLDHPDVVVGLQSLASCCVAQGNYAKAASLHHIMLEIWERTLGSDHPVIAARLERYAEILCLLDRKEDALKAQARSEKIRSRPKDRIQ